MPAEFKNYFYDYRFKMRISFVPPVGCSNLI